MKQWMKMFTDLQAGQEVTVGEPGELGASKPGKVTALNKQAMKDDFGQFVDRNQ